MPRKKKTESKTTGKKKQKATVKKTSKSRAKKVSKTAKKKTTKTPARSYYEAVGRRKRAVARIRLFTCRPFEGEEGRISVNDKPYNIFFPTLEMRQIVTDALRKMKSLNRFEAVVKVKGGGIRGQAEAIRHGLARALIKFNADFSKKLKRAGFLKRDPREKERKKPGLKKARRAPQWRKR